MAKKTNGHANGHGQPGHNSGRLWLQRAWMTIERDPEIDVVEEHWHKEKIYKESDLAVLAGISASTVHNMLNGKTRRPQHATFCKIFGAMNLRYKLERIGGAPNYAEEIPKARAEFKEYKSTLAKRKARKRPKP
jgi:hypothetical protein